MYKLDYNIILENHKKRVELLSDEQKISYENYKNNNEDSNLLMLRKSKQIPKVGDVFVLSYNDGEYYYGKVLESFEKWDTKVQVIVIFSEVIKEISIDKCIFNYDKLLLSPRIVFDGYWKKGFFQTIANIPLTNEEKKLNYGFFKMHPLGKYGYFVDSKGGEINYQPNLYSLYGVTNIIGIYKAIRLERLFDNV